MVRFDFPTENQGDFQLFTYFGSLHSLISKSKCAFKIVVALFFNGIVFNIRWA